MKSMLLLLILFPAVLLAQGVDVPLPTDQFLGMLLGSLGGIKGASAMGISVLVTQLIMAFFRTSLADFAGKYKLLIVYGLSMISGVLSLELSGVSLMSALIHATTLAAIQVFGHQVYVQFFQKEIPNA